jgi:exosortase/archaeosortase family protein
MSSTWPTASVRLPVAAAAAAGAVIVVGLNEAVRRVEAATSAQVVDLVGLQATSLNTAVTFPLDGRLVGYALTAGCSVAFLLSPLYLVVAGLVTTARLTVRRALVSLVVVTAVLFTVNQMRFAVIALSMRTWGFDRGYEISHVFLGTLVSTLGVLGGLLLLLRQVTHEQRRKPSADV